MTKYQLGRHFTACLNIRPTLSFEAAVAVIGEALGISFTEDQGGKYEEYPAYQAFMLGLEVALLAPPLPEFDIRDKPDDCYQLIINHNTYVEDQGVDVDLTALIESRLRACTELKLERVV